MISERVILMTVESFLGKGTLEVNICKIKVREKREGFPSKASRKSAEESSQSTGLQRPPVAKAVRRDSVAPVEEWSP
jgi:hypothetical protein